MRKVLLSILFFLSSFSLAGAGQEPVGLSERLVSGSVRASRMLRGETIDPDALRQTVRDMAREVQKRFRPGMTDREKIGVVNGYLFEEQGFRSDRSRLFETTLDGLLLDRVLERKTGNCLSLSLVYLMLAEELDLDVRAVAVPRHMFVRLVSKEGARNIETTDRGAQNSDRYYQAFFVNGPQRHASGRELNKAETAALYEANLAIHYNLSGQHDEALALLKKAADVFPDHAGIQTNLGNVYEHSGRIREAYAQYRNSLTVDPYICETYHNLGLLHLLYTHDYGRARRYGRTARQLGCRLHPRFRRFMERQ